MGTYFINNQKCNCVDNNLKIIRHKALVLPRYFWWKFKQKSINSLIWFRYVFRISRNFFSPFLPWLFICRAQASFWNKYLYHTTKAVLIIVCTDFHELVIRRVNGRRAHAMSENTNIRPLFLREMCNIELGGKMDALSWVLFLLNVTRVIQ